MKRLWLALFIFMGLWSSCTTTPKSNIYLTEGDSENEELPEHVEIKKVEAVKETEPDSSVPVITQGEELEVIPIEINDNVHMWIKYFQGRGRPHMERYLARSTRYEALMKKVLRDNKLPEDLFYIALIESGFSSRAFSHASAVGYWQFIRGTGKRYKLTIDRMVDERRDPVVATQAAANYFKDLYALTNSWYLSMASYNVGEGRVLRAVKKYKTNDFWELVKHRRALPKETDNYVPKYIAAKLIAKNPDKYGFDGIDYMPPIEFDYITFTQPVNLRTLSEKMNVNYEDFKDLNPKFKGEIAPLDTGGRLELRIPPGTQEAALKSFNDSIVSVVDFVPDQKENQIYIVRRGDTFSGIARKFRTNIAYLREINDIPRKKKLRIGQRMFVPDRTPVNVKKSPVQNNLNVIQAKATDQNVKPTTQYHVVKRGESLATIAQKYNTTVAELLKLNNLNRKSVLRTGVKIKLPGSNQSTNESSVRSNKIRVVKRNEVKRKIQTKVVNRNKKNLNRSVASTKKQSSDANYLKAKKKNKKKP